MNPRKGQEDHFLFSFHHCIFQVGKAPEQCRQGELYLFILLVKNTLCAMVTQNTTSYFQLKGFT